MPTPPPVSLAPSAVIAAAVATPGHAFEQAQRLCAAAREQPRFEVRACPDCRHGAKSRLVSHSGGESRLEEYECERCDETGALLTPASGRYEPTTEGEPGQLKGEPLPTLVGARDRLLDWTKTLAAYLRQGGRLQRYEWAAEQRDDLVLIAAALDAGADREEANAHLAEQLELERSRVEHLGKQLREMDAALRLEQKMREQDAVTVRELTAANAELRRKHGELDEHAQQLSAENEDLRSENGALRLEAEASRVAVQEATDAVLQAGADMTIQIAKHAAGEPS